MSQSASLCSLVVVLVVLLRFSGSSPSGFLFLVSSVCEAGVEADALMGGDGAAASFEAMCWKPRAGRGFESEGAVSSDTRASRNEMDRSGPVWRPHLTSTEDEKEWLWQDGALARRQARAAAIRMAAANVERRALLGKFKSCSRQEALNALLSVVALSRKRVGVKWTTYTDCFA